MIPSIDRDQFDSFISARIASDGRVFIGYPKGGPWHGRVFTEVEPAAAYAQRHNMEQGVYVCNNPPAADWTPPKLTEERDGGNNPKEENIPTRYRLQTDADPVIDDLAAAKSEALSLLDQFTTWAGDKMIRPTLIVDSGRGIHAHFDLACPIVSGEKADEVNKALIAWFKDRATLMKFDAVQNVNRMMRCPGTVNHRTGTIVRVLRREGTATA